MPNWNDILHEIAAAEKRGHEEHQTARDKIRKKYLTKLHHHTSRNLICYYSAFLSKPGVDGQSMTDEDKNGFMMAIHKMDRSKGLDLMLHTPGGSIASAQSLVHYLREMFGTDIRTIIPQIAMSAGTIVACCSKQIIMGKESNLGPIDPQVNGTPAHGVIAEFERAFKECSQHPERIPLWQAVISKYPPAFLEQCEQAIAWSNEFVRDQLKKCMFAAEPNAHVKAQIVVNTLSDFGPNKIHSNHIHYDECRKIGLNIGMLEDDDTLQDLVLTAHHCFMHVLMNTRALKIIENHNGVSMVKQVAPGTN